MPTSSIDLFCHILPAAYGDAAERLALRPLQMLTRARAIPAMMNLDARFRVMDRFPGYRQVPSLVSPPVEEIGTPDVARELAKRANDCLADLVQRHPDRFVSFVATLPLNDPGAALAEAERAVRHLGAAGIQVFTSVARKPLDRPEFLELFALAARLRVPVWLHPIRSMDVPDYPDEPYSKFDMWWALGWPYETTLAMARLVFAGVFDRWPDLVIITHHVGGLAPWLAGRLGPGLDVLGSRTPPEKMEAVRTSLRERPVDAFRHFYADTASFGSRAAIECGRAFFGLDHLVFASDMPFDPEGGAGHIRETLQAINEMELSDTDRAWLLAGNAERLLPKKDRVLVEEMTAPAVS